jgi:putative transcriptional regulator
MINSRLHILMGEKKIRSIRQLAEESKVTRLSLTRLYNGDAKGIEFDTLSKLCAYFQCDVGDLLHYEEGEN